jgi:FKBP-type peptidyl-prolyl cis-trans isomerase
VKTTWTTATALAALITLGLAGCGSDSNASPSASGTGQTTAGSEIDIATLATIEWKTDSAGVPQLTFDLPLGVASSAARLIQEGTGNTIQLGDTIQIDYTVTSGTDASLLYSTYDVGTPESLPLVDGQIDPVLQSMFVGHKAGVTVLYAMPDTSTATTTSTDVESLIFAITVNDVHTPIPPLSKAEGTAVAPVSGLPVVTLASSGAPSVQLPATDPPTDLVSQLLIQGTGATVADGQTIIAHYTGWLWDGTQFDSSWDAGTPLTISLAPGAVIDGWTQGLVGQTVGSQVLLIIPPSLGYGDADQGSIPAGSTLVFVVDILGIE